MSRQVETGALVIDSFPVLEDDGYSTKSGLGPSDFTVTVLHDGVVVALAVGIQEIGATGQYKVTFTPVLDGFYQVEVLVLYNHDIWSGSYESAAGLPASVLAYIKDQVDKIDLAPTLGPATVISGSLMDRMMNKNVQKTYNQGTDSLEAIRDRMG